MTWEEIKSRIYLHDGALRDVVVLNTTTDDWIRWSSFINENFEVTQKFHDLGTKFDNIKMDKVLDYWNGNHENSSVVHINLSGILVAAHFFDPDWIENDISPNDIKTIKDHEQVVNYMISLSKALGKQVLLTPENSHDFILISVLGDSVEFRPVQD